MAYSQAAKSNKTGEIQTFENKEDFDLHMKLHGTGATAKFYAVQHDETKAVEPKAGRTLTVTTAKENDAPKP